MKLPKLKSAYIIPLILLCSSAHAIESEISIGHTIFEKPENGIWWQEGPKSDGFTNTLNTDSGSYSIGLTDRFDRNLPIIGGIRWRTSYVYLGNVNTRANATPEDPQYNGSNGCVGSCPKNFNTFITESSVRGFSLTIAPEFRIIENIKIFFEGGAFISLTKFSAETYGVGKEAGGHWKEEYTGSWMIGKQLGAGIEYKNTQLVATYYTVPTAPQDDNAVVNFRNKDNNVFNIALRLRF